eukprot:CAMPEP_0183443674 /NCGR_PEP_ID=MMETSP0370-20130417/92635_1 /TAXON_ID=268820 /ORGANISM="Peridinium aciculiferum, Strain PAER-2" /LENGTH=290 /DNA_ID=CAMNT_0025633763 /DNA_START=39 /DNA_END=908 /DNA_ORIENTATION=-
MALPLGKSSQLCQAVAVLHGATGRNARLCSAGGSCSSRAVATSGGPPLRRLVQDASDKSVAVPIVALPAKGDIYAPVDGVVQGLLRVPLVQLRTTAGGAAVACRALRICSLAAQDLQKASGYLPGFGRLALRIDRYEASSHNLVATIGRLIDTPSQQDVDKMLVMRRDTDVETLAEVLAERMRAGEGEILTRSVGNDSACRLLQAVCAARGILMREEGPTSVPLAVAPTLGNALSSWSLDRLEFVSAVLRWSSPADAAPELPRAARLRAEFDADEGGEGPRGFARRKEMR